MDSVVKIMGGDLNLDQVKLIWSSYFLGILGTFNIPGLADIVSEEIISTITHYYHREYVTYKALPLHDIALYILQYVQTSACTVQYKCMHTVSARRFLWRLWSLFHWLVGSPCFIKSDNHLTFITQHNQLAEATSNQLLNLSDTCIFNQDLLSWTLLK